MAYKYYFSTISLILITSVLVFVNLKTLMEPEETEVFLKLDRKEVLFNAYLKRFDKHYSVQERERRFENFKQSLKEISLLNTRSGARHGLTKFSDLSKQEFAKYMNNTRYREFGECRTKHSKCHSPNIDQNVQANVLPWDYYTYDEFVKVVNGDIPHSFDWREKGDVIGPVLNQKLCNGCWAFGIVGVMESMTVIQKIEGYIRRSVQELIDCFLGNNCNGGHVTAVLDVLCQDKVGVMTEDDYPLLLVNEQCKAKYEPDSRRIKEFWTNCAMDEKEILRRIAYHGPVIAVINADPLKNYIDGIIQRSCFRSHDGLSIDHVVQIVGYDLTGDIGYYIVKNSWGEDFGEDGYVKIEYGGNVCGIADEITYFDVY